MRLNHTHKSLGGEKIMETRSFQAPLSCPIGLWQGPRSWGSQGHWGAALGRQHPFPGLGLRHQLTIYQWHPLVVTSGCVDWCVPTPNHGLVKGAPAQ